MHVYLLQERVHRIAASVCSKDSFSLVCVGLMAPCAKIVRCLLITCVMAWEL